MTLAAAAYAGFPLMDSQQVYADVQETCSPPHACMTRSMHVPQNMGPPSHGESLTAAQNAPEAEPSHKRDNGSRAALAEQARATAPFMHSQPVDEAPMHAVDEGPMHADHAPLSAGAGATQSDDIADEAAQQLPLWPHLETFSRHPVFVRQASGQGVSGILLTGMHAPYP